MTRCVSPGGQGWFEDGFRGVCDLAAMDDASFIVPRERSFGPSRGRLPWGARSLSFPSSLPWERVGLDEESFGRRPAVRILASVLVRRCRPLAHRKGGAKERYELIDKANPMRPMTLP